MEKKIGIYGWSMGDNSWGVSKTYLDFASTFGNVHILMPHQKFEEVDLLILPGGMDVNPLSYGAVPSFYASNTDVFKQYMYDECLPIYIEKKTPIFGICLGLQQLAVNFGSTLEQNLPYHKNSPDRYKKGHEIEFTDECVTLGLLGKHDKKKVDVNSHHHQGVILCNLGSDLTTLARADNEGSIHVGEDIVEAFVHNTLPIAACQWHPEEWMLNDGGFAKRLVQLLLSGRLNRE